MNLSLGKIIQERRNELGLSVEQVSSETKISVRILRSIEEDDYKNLPAKPFVRGFVLNYCKLLGLNGEELLKEHHQFFEEKTQEREDKSGGHSGYTFEERELEQNRRWIGILASAGIVFVAGALFVLKPKLKKRSHQPTEITQKDSESGAASQPSPADIEAPEIKNTVSTETVISVARNEPTLSKADSSATPVPTATPAAMPVVTPTATATPVPTPPAKPTATPVPNETIPAPTPAVVPPAKPDPAALDPLHKGDELTGKDIALRASFKSTGDQYVSYKADQKPPMQLILRNGKFLVIKAKESIRFKTSDASKLQVRYAPNGPYTVMQKPGLIMDKGSGPQTVDDVPGISGASGTPPPSN